MGDGENGRVRAHGQPVPELRSQLGADTQRRPARFVADHLNGIRHENVPGLPAEQAPDVVAVAADAIGADVFLPVVEADEEAHHDTRRAIDQGEVLGDVDRAVGEIVAVGAAIGVGEFDLTDEIVLIVEAPAVEPAAVEEAATVSDSLRTDHTNSSVLAVRPS